MPRRIYSLVFIFTGLGLIVLFFVIQWRQNDVEDKGGQAVTIASRVGRDNLSDASQLSPAASSLVPSPATLVSPTPDPPRPTATPQPIYPTPTAGSLIEQQPRPTFSPVPADFLMPPLLTPCPIADCLARFGISGGSDEIEQAYEAGLPFGGYLTWNVNSDPPLSGGTFFWQMIKLTEAGPRISWEQLAEIVAMRPGSVWIVGNEPDVIWQDNVKPGRYAQIYHDVYGFIKERDAGARIAIAGVAQPTPLRLAYLDIILQTYQENYGTPMPVDIWTIHGFILPERAGSWGVEIPPGLEATAGRLYELGDHNDLEIFQENLIDFRDWMAQRGYADNPLAVTEFGILHPSDYGFPQDVVAKFMLDAHDFLLNATGDNGYPADDGRLFQWWFWYSVFDGSDFPTGNLYNPANDSLTPLGEIYANYVRSITGVDG